MVNPRRQTCYSKVSVKSQTVLPREVRERLAIKPGDRIRYVTVANSIRIEKGNSRAEDDPFVAFTEWASEEDNIAFSDL